MTQPSIAAYRQRALKDQVWMAEMQARMRELERGLQLVMCTLGPEMVADCPENRCAGCAQEMADALQHAREALGI